MRTNDLLAVINREADLLEEDNWHVAAAVMRETAERMRVLAQRLRRAGLSAEEGEDDLVACHLTGITAVGGKFVETEPGRTEFVPDSSQKT